jgi:hypothetical protein
MAAPHVAGVAALMLGQSAALGPAQVTAILQDTARPFAADSNCPTLCGAGIIDAYAALGAVTPPPGTPALLAPADGALLDTDRPALEWSAVPEATGYRLVVAAGSLIVDAVIDVVVAETTYTPPEPLETGDYIWRVRALAEDGTPGAWSEIWSFAVNANECVTPPAPALLAPADGATGAATPSFAWGAVADAGRYEVQVDDDADLSSPLLAAQSLGTSYTPQNPLPPGVYYWRARGWTVGQPCEAPGAWSEAWSFTIEEEVVVEHRLFVPAVVGD